MINIIESNVIEFLDFGDLVQNIDVYSKKKFIYILRFFRTLTKNKSIPIIINIILILIFFIQLWAMCIIFVPSDGDIILNVLERLKKVILFYEIITNKTNYLIIFIIAFTIIMIDLILMIILFFINNKVNTPILIFIINFLNIIIFYYLIGPIIDISLTSIWCEHKVHKFLEISCFSNSTHLTITILSFIMLLIYLLVSFIYSFYCSEIEIIEESLKENTIGINCNYSIFCLISKILIFIFGFLVKKNENNFIYKIVYEIYCTLTCLIMSIYTYKNVYYYNNIINSLNLFCWFISISFSFSILLKTLLQLKGVSNFIIFGWIIIILSLYKLEKIKEYLLITKKNIFEFKNVKSLETYKNILLNKLRNNNNNSKILIFGIIKKFNEFSKNNPEINYHYQKLLNDQNLIRKSNNKNDLPIISIIYILYTYYLEKFLIKDEITFHMCYFLINKFKNISYAMYLCSKIKTRGIKSLYYKYLLTEDIKEYLIFKLKKNSNKESIKHVQIGSVILYYLYIDLFKIKIYDATTNQIDYFDLLKNSITTNKTTKNFLKSSETILKSRKEIMNIWAKIIELNPFSDEYHKDYILYLDTIIQDEFLSKEESKKYILLKNNKANKKNNIYHKMFLSDTSSVLLVDGYLAYGKILYASQNFPLVFMYTGKEILSLSIDDLLPNVIQSFHKELIEDSMKFSNINYVFKKQRDSLLRNKNGGLFNIKLFVKPAPNLSYGLIYYLHLQKIYDSNFIIVLDKDLKINGFTEIIQSGSLFTMSNAYNLSHNIIGYNIGLIIPDILSLIEYRNEEFNIIKKDCELKGYLYPVDRNRDIRNKVNKILDKIKNNKINISDYQGQIEDDPQNISVEFYELIKELNRQKITPFKIFYRIKLYNFLEDKYKYYRIYINNNVLSENEYNPSAKFIKDKSESPNQSDKYKNNLEFISSVSKISKDSKMIKVLSDKKHILGFTNKTNGLENSGVLSKNTKNINFKINKKQTEKKNIENSNDSNNKINDINDVKKNSLNSNSLSNSKSNIAMSGFNKIKNDIINKKEIIPLKIMKIICYIFIIITIGCMILDLFKQIYSFNQLSNFLMDNLFFNKTKIAIASLYTISVNIRWLSHSIFQNSTACLYGNWIEFNKLLLKESLKYVEIQKNASNYLGEDFNDILTKRFPIELNVHRFEEKEKYDFTFDNIMTFLVNSIIKVIDQDDYYISLNCKEIPKIVGLNETKLQNLIDQTFNFYISNISGFKGNEKIKKIEKNFYSFPIPLMIISLFLLCILILYIYYITNLYYIEIYFLEKLINFNSPNFENYFKKLDEIKKKLRNDNSEEEEKVDDMDFNDLDSKKKEEEDGEKNDIKDEKKLNEKDKRKKKKKKGNQQNKIQQLKKKKLAIMKSFFFKINVFFIIKIIFIIIISLSYFLIITLLKSKFKNDFLFFDSINDSIYGVYKDSYNIFIMLKRQLDMYERRLVNCTTIENKYEIRLPKSLTPPKLGNLLMQITSDSSYNKKTIDKFKLLYSENACKILVDNINDMPSCEKYWSGVLLKGMEQAITHMGIIIGTVMNELEALNTFNSPIVLFNLMNQSTFIMYEQFTEYYLLRAYNKTTYVFKDLREERLNSIILIIKYILLSYIMISIIVFILLTYFTFKYKYIFNSFLNFIGILPIQYLSEDENLYNEIISFGNKYY